MKIAETLLLDFDPEMHNTRTTLDRIPLEHADFKPHEKSMAWGRLAAHVASLYHFGTTILTTDVFDVGAGKSLELVFESREKLLRDFESGATETRRHLSEASDEKLLQNWKLVWGQTVIAEAPRAVLYRTMFFNHLIHHRAQLGVYLRLNNLPVPPLYGPSADDRMGF